MTEFPGDIDTSRENYLQLRPATRIRVSRFVFGQGFTEM